MFNQQEVQILIGGIDSPINLEDLQQNTHYGGLYDEKHETIIAFWKVYLVLVTCLATGCLSLPSIRLSTLSTRNRKELCYDLSRVVAGPLFCSLPFLLFKSGRLTVVPSLMLL